MRERAAEDESAGLDADDDLDALALIVRGEQIDDTPEGGAVLQQRCDVLEKDALGREVLDVADLCSERGDVVHWRASSYRRRRPRTRRGVAALKLTQWPA